MSAENGDPLAQSVEHHTFNVGVLGSNPKRITKGAKNLHNQQKSIRISRFDGLMLFLFYNVAQKGDHFPMIYVKTKKIGKNYINCDFFSHLCHIK